MYFRAAVLLIATITAPLAVGQQAQSAKTAKILELFRITKAEQMQKQILAQITASMDPAARAQSAKLMNFVSEKMGWETMKPQYLKLYDETFTEEEITGILKFYQSGPGQTFLAKMPTLTTNMMTMVQTRMAELRPELERMARESAEGAKH